jgi:hypothetical protein
MTSRKEEHGEISLREPRDRPRQAAGKKVAAAVKPQLFPESASPNISLRTFEGIHTLEIPHAAYSISFVGNLLASGGCPEPGAFSCGIGEVRLYRIK